MKKHRGRFEYVSDKYGRDPFWYESTEEFLETARGCGMTCELHRETDKDGRTVYRDQDGDAVLIEHE